MERPDLFFSLFESLPRQGPGSASCTARAWRACADVPAAPRIVDLGCGGGAQTLDLARLVPNAAILAVDAHAPLVEILRRKVAAGGFRGRVEARVGDMRSLARPEGGVDVVWSEGALYNLGLEAALPLCRSLLRPGGCLAFSDAVWRVPEPDARARALFADYPTMGRAADVLALAERLGWRVLEHFALPDDAWWNEFYAPMEARIEALRREHAADAAAQATLSALAAEPALHRELGSHYGYAFFVLQSPG